MKDFVVNIKMKLAALWTSVMFLFIYGDYFELYTPGKVDGLVSGENILNSPTVLLIASIVLAIPSLMIFLSLILKPNLNRWLNIVFGLLFTLMMLLIAVGSLTPWYSFYVLYAVLESILTATIVWHAYNWPKEVN